MTTIDHLEITMDRQKAWRTGASLVLVAFGIFSFSALLHYHVVHEGRSSVGSPLLAPVLGLSSALGFVGALSLSLLLTLWASIAFVTDTWAEPLRRIWISIVFALCLSVFVDGLDYDGGALGGPIATRMAFVLGGDFSTFLLGLLTLLAFLLATNWLFFENFLALARAREDGIEPGLAELEEQLLQSKDAGERDRILESFDARQRAKPSSPAAFEQETTAVASADSSAVGVLDGSDVSSAAEDPRVASPRDAAGSPVARSRVGRAVPVPTPIEGSASTSAPAASGSGLSESELKSTRDRRDRIRSARVRRDQAVLDEILAEVRSSIGPEIEDSTGREGGDPMADLDDDLLLEKAGQALDELLGEGGGSLELNLPEAQGLDTEETAALESTPSEPDASATAAGDEVGNQDVAETESRIQTAMGRIPVVDRNVESREESGRVQDELFPAEPRSGLSHPLSPEPRLPEELVDPAPAAPDATAPDAMAPDAMVTDREDQDSESSGSAVAEDADRSQAGAPDSIESAPAEQEVAASDAGSDSRSADPDADDVQREPAEADIPAPIPEASQAPMEAIPEDASTRQSEEQSEEPSEEPVFILEPQPTMRIYGDSEPAEPAEYTQEELFADEPPDPDLLDRAARVLLTSRRPTVSLLQRRIGLSFAEARQVMFYMQQLGALAAPAGSGPWDALISLGEWDERRA